MVHRLVLVEGHRAAAVERGTRGEHLLHHPVFPLALEEVERAQSIGGQVEMRMLDTVAHPGAGGQIEHRIELVDGKESVEGGQVLNVEEPEDEPSGVIGYGFLALREDRCFRIRPHQRITLIQ